jgi:hypothetical protein
MQTTLSQLHFTIENQKVFKLNSDSLCDNFHKITKYGCHIKPMPIISKKVGNEGDPKLINKIAIKEYKYVSQVAASGEYTHKILNKIKKTSCLKLVRKIDFDPYFCNKSGIKELSEALNRFGNRLSHLILTIRKIEGRNDTRQLSSSLARLNKMKRIKIDIPSKSEMDSKDFKHLDKACKKLYSLKSIDLCLGGSKDTSQDLQTLGSKFQNSHKVEKVSLYVDFSHEKDSPVEDVLRESKGKSRSRAVTPLKSMSFKFGFKTGWASYFDGVGLGQGFNMFVKAMPYFPSPIHFSLRFDKLPMSSEFFQTFAEVMPQLSNLRHLFLELNRIKLAEYELLTLAKGFVDCKQLEHLTFKYLDNAILPMADILKFIVILAKYSAFPKFDLLFRKLLNPQWQTPEAKRELDSLENIKYVLTKQSIHVQKLQCLCDES